MRSAIEREIGIAHLCQRIEFRVRVVFPRHLREVFFARAVLVDVNLCDPPEQFREHKIAVLRFFIVIIGRRAEDVGAVERRHGFLLFRADHEHDIVKSADDPLGAEQNGKRAGSTSRFGVHRRNAAQFRIDLWNERAELQLFGELAGIEIADRARLNFRGINLRIVDRFLAGLCDQMPDGFAFLLQVALKIGASAAENVN